MVFLTAVYADFADALICCLHLSAPSAESAVKVFFSEFSSLEQFDMSAILNRDA